MTGEGNPARSPGKLGGYEGTRDLWAEGRDTDLSWGLYDTLHWIAFRRLGRIRDWSGIDRNSREDVERLIDRAGGDFYEDMPDHALIYALKKGYIIANGLPLDRRSRSHINPLEWIDLDIFADIEGDHAYVRRGPASTVEAMYWNVRFIAETVRTTFPMMAGTGPDLQLERTPVKKEQ